MTFYDFALRFATEHEFLAFCVIVCVAAAISAPFQALAALLRRRY